MLKSKIEKLTWVDSVITVIDVPLLKSTDEGLMDRLKNYKTLAYPEIDRKRGFDEIINSPIYRDYVISKDGKTSGIVVYLKKDERLAEYVKIKDKYFEQSNETGLTKEEKINYKKFIKEYEDYKNLYNIRNHQNISEIRDVISKYGQNAKIHLGGIPMIADDMMSYIKNDIIGFWYWCFYFYNFNTLVYFQKFKMGNNAIIGLCNFSSNNDRLVRFNWMEGNCNFLKLYCINAYFKYGDEYPFNCEIFTIKKRVSSID